MADQPPAVPMRILAMPSLSSASMPAAGKTGCACLETTVRRCEPACGGGCVGAPAGAAGHGHAGADASASAVPPPPRARARCCTSRTQGTNHAAGAAGPQPQRRSSRHSPPAAAEAGACSPGMFMAACWRKGAASAAKAMSIAAPAKPWGAAEPVARAAASAASPGAPAAWPADSCPSACGPASGTCDHGRQAQSQQGGAPCAGACVACALSFRQAGTACEGVSSRVDNQRGCMPGVGFGGSTCSDSATSPGPGSAAAAPAPAAGCRRSAGRASGPRPRGCGMRCAWAGRA